jgi:hypothetical protein
VLKTGRRFLALSAAIIMMSSIGSAADLRLKIHPTAARQGTTPTPTSKTRKQLFEEFLQWRRQQSR